MEQYKRVFVITSSNNDNFKTYNTILSLKEPNKKTKLRRTRQ